MPNHKRLLFGMALTTALSAAHKIFARLSAWYCTCRPVLMAGVLVSIATPICHAQSTPARSAASANTEHPAYDVVSIKLNKSGSNQSNMVINDGNFDALNISLRALIISAFNVKQPQIFGLPKWDSSTRFDIKAKVVDADQKMFETFSGEQFRLMQQPILTDRFQLKFHYEQKMLPVYVLVIAKGGPRFKESKISGDDKAPNGIGAGSMRVNNSTMSSTAISTASLATMLSTQVQRIVIDKTGLSGKYDLELTWSRDGATSTVDSNAPPSIFTALQEQLGLKLEPAKDAIKAFVIDHVELPSED